MTAIAPTYEELLTEVAALRINANISKANESFLKEKVVDLEGQLEWFRKQFFGSKSERLISDSPQQLVFFPEMAPVEKQTKEKIPGYERNKGKPGEASIKLPANLPIERIQIDLPAEEKVCKVTGELLVKIGEEITRKLAHRPGSFYIKEIVRPKYAAPNQKEAGVRIAPLPTTLLTRCLADESLLASILVAKFGDYQRF